MSFLRLGTRGSELALAQADYVAARLRRLGHEIEIVRIKTTGDKTPGPLSEVGGKAAWVAEIEQALLDGVIDLSVHSAKDLPAELGEGLTIGAYPQREDPRDVFVGPRVGGASRRCPPARASARAACGASHCCAPCGPSWSRFPCGAT